MKYDNMYYMQLSRCICDDEHVKRLSIGARMLFVTLNELEQRYCNNKTRYFFRTNEELAKDMGVSVNSIKKYKAELKANGKDLVHMGKGHWIYEKDGVRKKSEQYFTSYEILR